MTLATSDVPTALAKASDVAPRIPAVNVTLFAAAKLLTFRIPPATPVVTLAAVAVPPPPMVEPVVAVVMSVPMLSPVTVTTPAEDDAEMPAALSVEFALIEAATAVAAEVTVAPVVAVSVVVTV